MITNRSFMDQVWIDLNSPSREEVDSLVLAQNINLSVAKDLLAPTPKQYAEEAARGDVKAIYAVLHIPAFHHSHALSLEQEIDFIITDKELVTTRYDSIDALHNFAKKIEVNEILGSENHSHLFFGLMKEIYLFLFNEIEYTKDWIKDIEKNIFEGYEKEMVFGISAASRNILNFNRIVLPHKGVFTTLLEIGKDDFGSKFEKDIKKLIAEWDRLTTEIKNISDMLHELRETNDSILSSKQNEIMKNLTVFAFIVIPIATISQVFGMNTTYNPIEGLPYDFWVIVSFTLLVTLATFSYFKYKKWI